MVNIFTASNSNCHWSECAFSAHKQLSMPKHSHQCNTSFLQEIHYIFSYIDGTAIFHDMMICLLSYCTQLKASV
jgi:hypothetical protein